MTLPLIVLAVLAAVGGFLPMPARRRAGDRRRRARRARAARRRSALAVGARRSAGSGSRGSSTSRVPSCPGSSRRARRLLPPGARQVPHRRAVRPRHRPAAARHGRRLGAGSSTRGMIDGVVNGVGTRRGRRPAALWRRAPDRQRPALRALVPRRARWRSSATISSDDSHRRRSFAANWQAALPGDRWSVLARLRRDDRRPRRCATRSRAARRPRHPRAGRGDRVRAVSAWVGRRGPVGLPGHAARRSLRALLHHRHLRGARP